MTKKVILIYFCAYSILVYEVNFIIFVCIFVKKKNEATWVEGRTRDEREQGSNLNHWATPFDLLIHAQNCI